MNEEDLRIQQIKMKIKGLTFEQAREISKLCSEYYIEGLEQSRFDKNMLEVELSGYRQAILQNKELMGLKEAKDKLQNNWNELKKFVEDDIKYWEEQEKEWIKLGFMKFGGEANTKHIFRRVLNKMQELEKEV